MTREEYIEIRNSDNHMMLCYLYYCEEIEKDNKKHLDETVFNIIMLTVFKNKLNQIIHSLITYFDNFFSILIIENKKKNFIIYC